MSRLLCTGDLHLNRWPGLAPVDRLADQAQLLAEIADLADEHRVDAVLLAGDVFHQPRPAPDVLRVFRDFVDEMTYAETPLVAITGNAGHDIENGDRPCALELFAHLVNGEFHVHRQPGLVALDGVTVATLPSVQVARLVAARNGGDRDQVNADAAELLVAAARALRAQIPDGTPAVLLAHWSISGAVTPDGADVGLFREPVLPLHDLEQLGFDAVIAGHIHKAQLLSTGRLVQNGNGSHVTDPASRVFYVGSPMPLSHGEAKSKHGVWILDLAADTLEFVELESRRFVTIDVDITGATETSGLAYVDVGYQANDLPEGAIVRARIRATADQWRRVDVPAIRDGLARMGASRITIEPDIVREDRARVEGVDEHLDELAALDLWITASDVSDPAPLRERTARYLEATA